MRLDQLEERMGDAISVEWRSFLLRPEPKTPDQEKFVEYTRSWLRPAEMEPATDFLETLRYCSRLHTPKYILQVQSASRRHH